ncbi:Uncharacterised protein [Vibrio cholerae]|nr:Uncharacterised protein [Vibrio cholerae]
MSLAAISQKPSPPILFMWGYCTAIIAAAATIASQAVPLWRRISKPVSLAL